MCETATPAIPCGEGPRLITPLADLCLESVAANFERRRCLDALPPQYVSRGLALLPLDLPLEVAGSLGVPDDEVYWRRRACARWRNPCPEAHGGSWKQMYFERNLQDALEGFGGPGGVGEEDLRRLMTYSRRFVVHLCVRRLPSHLDLQIIFDAMVNSPAGLSLCYGMKGVGMEYERTLFGMKLSDCRSLARALERTETLTYLDLSSNLLDDDKTRMLASGLVDNISITHLDLSHNKVADRGVRALARVLDGRSVVATLSLYDNHVHREGGRALARALRGNKSIRDLNLRLNRLGEEGCRSVVDALRANESLRRLNLSANDAGELTAEAMSAVLRRNTVLAELDLSSNAIGDVGGAAIRAALEENSVLRRLDLRDSGVGTDEEAAIEVGGWPAN
ncbi:unnamed protein product [Ostreobium quekettii]|uniref:Uncharacterized protein n=1 Tax=Ostreobium quekettii TaxID=121088 RepID=A0A8S1J3R6_9CHLO|nr:unnamed protein product [Ostreobium quekettii]